MAQLLKIISERRPLVGSRDSGSHFENVHPRLEITSQAICLENLMTDTLNLYMSHDSDPSADDWHSGEHPSSPVRTLGRINQLCNQHSDFDQFDIHLTAGVYWDQSVVWKWPRSVDPTRKRVRFLGPMANADPISSYDYHSAEFARASFGMPAAEFRLSNDAIAGTVPWFRVTNGHGFEFHGIWVRGPSDGSDFPEAEGNPYGWAVYADGTLNSKFVFNRCLFSRVGALGDNATVASSGCLAIFSAQQMIVDGCFFRDNGNEVGNLAAFHNIYLEGFAEDCLIIHNNFSRTTGAVIRLENACRRNIIQWNRFKSILREPADTPNRRYNVACQCFVGPGDTFSTENVFRYNTILDTGEHTPPGISLRRGPISGATEPPIDERFYYSWYRDPSTGLLVSFNDGGIRANWVVDWQDTDLRL